MAKNPDNHDEEASVNKPPAPAAAAATRFTDATLEMSANGIPKCIVITPSWSTRKASSLVTVVNPHAGSVESFLLHLLENSFTTQHLVELMKKYGSRLELFLGPNTRVALLPESELTSGLRKQHQANTHGDDATSDAKDATLALTSQYRKTLTPVHLMMAREVHLKFDAVASLYYMIADVGETLKIVADKAPHHRHVVDKQTEEMRYILVPSEKKTAARKEAAAKKKEAAPGGKTNGDKEEDAPAAKKARKEAPAAEADPAKKPGEDESSTTCSPSEEGSSSSEEEEEKGKPAAKPAPKSPPKKAAAAAAKTTPKSKAKKAKAKKGDESDNTQDEETPKPPPTPKSTKKAKATPASKSTAAKDSSATDKKSTQKKKNKRKRK